MIDVVALTQALLRADSVTPARGPVFDVLEAALTGIGFAVDRFVCGEAPDGPVENMIATRHGIGRHLAFAGHVDVVPPGEGWTGSPWSGEVRGDLLHGRGAVDMKGAVAAFAAAASRVDGGGPLSLLITGDEEGPATYGTPALIARMAERDIAPDLCLVGEPTSVHRLGDMVKIGRRGSVNIWIDVPGRQGHVAYPHLADNPVTRLVRALAALDAMPLDAGNAWFQPSNLEITEVTVGNPAHNVIPAAAAARLNIRFNDEQTGLGLIERVTDIVHAEAPEARVHGKISGEAFLTAPGALTALVSGAILAQTGIEAELSTTGGTSDARFLSKLCPTIEFGLINATMHQVDEAVAVADLETLTAIYADVIRRTASV
ncbi:succinyl-diaminopimelate desuccinylase [Sphingomonas sp. MA1305]|uniref:succinyl-diaminopimelate desuccinylase n=1 Tax=Sphingomonas sp. MA1305 TaxID=2479204 RepID=UPI0018DFF770|nr:succinyl-diaminopimelate desuccinylase [Sphingomonas sp. MA1305]